MGAFQDLTGQVFGRLTVVDRAPTVDGTTIWRCVCECGTGRSVPASKLRQGKSRSCGCLKREVTAAMGRACATHGKFGTPEYSCWAQMKRRCERPKCRAYPNYGGRGIRVCDHWATFQPFFADMGPRPSPQHTIERVDTNGNYEPGNCKWATMGEQSRNRRDTVLVTIDDRTMCMKDWAAEMGIPQSTVQSRLARGWTPMDALQRPVEQRHRRRGVRCDS